MVKKIFTKIHGECMANNVDSPGNSNSNLCKGLQKLADFRQNDRDPLRSRFILYEKSLHFSILVDTEKTHASYKKMFENLKDCYWLFKMVIKELRSDLGS